MARGQGEDEEQEHRRLIDEAIADIFADIKSTSGEVSSSGAAAFSLDVAGSLTESVQPAKKKLCKPVS